MLNIQKGIAHNLRQTPQLLTLSAVADARAPALAKSRLVIPQELGFLRCWIGFQSPEVAGVLCTLASAPEPCDVQEWPFCLDSSGTRVNFGPDPHLKCWFSAPLALPEPGVQRQPAHTQLAQRQLCCGYHMLQHPSPHRCPCS